MPNMSAYPPTQNVMPGGAGEPAPMQQGGAPQANSAAEKMTNPFFQALKVIGIGIKTAQASGSPQAGQMSQAFSGLLQSMSDPSVAGAQRGPAAPQAAPGQPPAAPMPQAAPAPVPSPAPAAQPAPAMGQMPQRPMGQAPGVRPFGAPTAGQRPVSKQPVII